MKLLLTALAASSIAFATPITSAQVEATSETTASQTLLTAKVNGMVCDFCARAVTKVFGKEAAVETVHVDLDKGEIHVTLKSGTDLSDARVASLVKKSGYDLVAGGIKEADPKNPALAARLLTAFEQWRSLEPTTKAKAERTLKALQAGDLSKNASDIIGRTLS